jgi:hypothetical protein
VIPLPEVPAAEEPAENGVAAVPDDALLGLGCEVDCAARSAASCAQGSFWPDIELSILSSWAAALRHVQPVAGRVPAAAPRDRGGKPRFRVPIAPRR